MFILQAVWLWIMNEDTHFYPHSRIFQFLVVQCAPTEGRDSGIKDSSVYKNPWEVERLRSWRVSVIEKPHRLGCSIVTSWSSAVTGGTVKVTNTMTRLTWAEVTDLFGLLRCSCQWHNISPHDCNSPDRTAFSTDQNQTQISFWHQEQDNTQCASRVGSPHVSSLLWSAKKRQIFYSVCISGLFSYFYRKIGIFHMQISCIHQRMALKETNILQKP